MRTTRDTVEREMTVAEARRAVFELEAELMEQMASGSGDPAREPWPSAGDDGDACSRCGRVEPADGDPPCPFCDPPHRP